jgi:hypothetical protein
MARSVNQALWDQWRRRVEKHRTSGLSILEFCRKEQVSPHLFHVWKRKLFPASSTRLASGEAAGTQRFRKRRRIATPGPWGRRTLANPMPPGRTEFLPLPVTAAQGSPWIELALADGTILRLPQQNLTALVTVLRVLRGERTELPGGERGHA